MKTNKKKKKNKKKKHQPSLPFCATQTYNILSHRFLRHVYFHNLHIPLTMRAYPENVVIVASRNQRLNKREEKP